MSSEEHYTIIFNTFVYCQIFNEINARKVDGTLNVFAGIFRNYLFIGIIIFEAVLQALLVEVPGLNNIFHCVNLTWREWLLCVGIGSFSLIIGVILNLMTPLFPKDRALTSEDYEGLDEDQSDEELDELKEKQPLLVRK
jgi:P-type Ca2+ transporter type 2C